MKKYTYLAVMIYLIGLSGYIGFKYHHKSENLTNQNYQTLLQAASLANIYLPDKLKESNLTQQSLSPEEDTKTRLALSDVAAQFGIKYIYSFYLNGDIVHFTSSSATPEELKSNEGLSYYWDVYDDASENLLKAFKTHTVQYDEETEDQWGLLRSAFVPFRSASGATYIIGADIEMKNINDQITDLTLDTLFEAAFYLLLLLPFFITYRYQNLRVKEELETQVEERTKDLSERSEAIARLLNNANQGFLTITKDLKVEKEYSQKCIELFEQDISSKDVAKLLLGDDPRLETFRLNLISLFSNEDEHKTQTIISLLPDEFTLLNRIVHTSYKKISNERFLIILTDITETKSLEKSLEKEHDVFKMVVTALQSRDELIEIIEDYTELYNNLDDFYTSENSPKTNISNLYRSVHTLKALFAQQNFILLPRALHQLESKLSVGIGKTDLTNDRLQEVLGQIDFQGWLEKDLMVLSSHLGDEFLNQRSRIHIEEHKLEEWISTLRLFIDKHTLDDQNLTELLHSFYMLQQKPLQYLMRGFPKHAEQISQKLSKQLHPLQIVCDKTIVLEANHKNFIKSLIHVIRNAIDHGIESPEERVQNGKSEYGTIVINAYQENGSVWIDITDDGRGIDFTSILTKAKELNIDTTLYASNPSELIFLDNISAKTEITCISGRGIGLSAVYSELKALQGRVTVTSHPGQSTTFLFQFPQKLNKMDTYVDIYHNTSSTQEC